MAFKVILRKLQVIKLKRFISRAIADRGSPKKPSSWIGISHGLVEKGGSEGSLIAQREQIETSEVWLFGAFDQDTMGGEVPKYLQTNLFDKNLSEDQFERKVKETMKKAYISARAKMQAQGEEAHEMGGFTTAIVMNGERFVAADFGGYKAVVCRAGVGIQIGRRHQNRQKTQWFLSGITGKLFGHKGDHKPNTSAPLVIVTGRVETETEFIILASDGIWEVLRDQEAVDLISHMDDAQEAAECLAKEAFNRMSKSTISCVVIRFG